jgi:class 3 adenylate cyclase/predicted ATPase
VSFEEVLDQASAMLQRRGRLTYRMLKRQFHLDAEALEDLAFELIKGQRLAIDEEGEVLVWTGEPLATTPDAHRVADAERRFHTLLPAVIGLLQSQKRVTYRTLTYVFSIDATLLEEIREELTFRRLACDEDGKGLVWTGEVQSPVSPLGAMPNQPALPDAMTVRSTAVPPLPPRVTASLAPSHGPTVLTPDEAPTTLESLSTPAVDGSAAGAVPEVLSEAPPSARNTPEAERRQLTVMFCDLADSTRLAQQLDAEDLREVVRAYQATAAAVMHQYAGHIAQYLGDGVLVYFGWPVAHEDDALRSVHAGLGLVEAITTQLNPRLEREHGVQLAVRIGLHTGPVVVGEMGDGGRHAHLATGDTVNIASRLEGLAAPNTVVISQVTARLVRQAFALDDLGRHELKGITEPIPVFRVRGPLEAPADQPTVAGVPFLVGRDEELGLLRRRWAQARERLGQVVLLSGTAGLGKSALTEVLRTQVRDEGCPRIAFRCSAYHQHSALYPVITHVERVLDVQREDAPATRLDKLEQGLRPYHLSLEEVVPLFAALLSVPLDGRYPAPTLSPQQQKQQTLDALVAWMLEAAERQPVLVAWEDLHWADPSTLEMLELVLEQTPTVPMLHVLTYRPEFTPPWPMRSHLTPITLNRLERPQVEAFITHLAGGKDLPVEVVQYIVAKTDGVPLYVEELTKMLLRSALLREDADHYTLTGPLGSVTIPNTLQDALMARLDQMHTAKEVAQVGAVLGREFVYAMLQALTPQDEATVQASLAQLVGAELLYQRGRPPRATYTFKHALIQDAAYASLLRSTRQRVHQQVVQLYETRFPEVVETQPEVVARHCTAAGQDEAAIRYWQQAGQRALQRSAHAEAMAHLRQGLAVLTTLPETPACLQQELDLQVALGTALRATQGQAAPDVERAYARARELCAQLGDTPQLFPVLRGLMTYYQNRGDLQTTSQLGEQLLRLAQAQPDPALHMLAHYQLGNVLFWRGEPAVARTHQTQALALYDPQAHRALAVRYGVDLGVASHSTLARALWCLGYPEQALQHSQAARTLAEEVAHPFSLAQALVYAAQVHQWRREVLAVHAQAASAMTLATERGLAQWVARGTVVHGWALAMQGQGEAGIAEIRQGLAADLATGSRLWQPYCLGLLAEAYGAGGHPDAGLTALAEALAVTDTTELRYYAAELYRLKGVLLLQQAAPDAAQAETCFHQALDIARQQQARSWELRTATSLAHLWQSQGKCQEASALLAPVYHWFTEGFDTADVQEAQALVEKLSQ